MTESEYVAIYIRTDPRFCRVEELGDLENPGDLTDAIPMKHRFPAGLKVDLSPNGGGMVTDFINNGERVLIASQKARTILEAEGIHDEAAEYLPIVLRDQRGKPLQESFFIVNVLATVDCFDWTRSTYETYRNNPRRISSASLEVLHIVPENIPEQAKLFRLGELKRELIIRTDLLERLRSAGCEGLCVVPMGEERI